MFCHALTHILRCCLDRHLQVRRVEGLGDAAFGYEGRLSCGSAVGDCFVQRVYMLVVAPAGTYDCRRSSTRSSIIVLSAISCMFFKWLAATSGLKFRGVVVFDRSGV